MRVVIQRVKRASVTIDGERRGQIGPGLVALVAVGSGDGLDEIAFIKKKLLNLRIFPDAEGKMNYSILDVGGQILLVSQFTLYGDCRKGNRPSYSQAESPLEARRVWDQLVREMLRGPVEIVTGEFQAMMEVELVNDGPVTLILES